MKRKVWLMGALVTLCASSAVADAWVVFMSARVTAIVQWQDNADVLFEVASQTYCYLPAGEKKRDRVSDDPVQHRAQG